MLNGVCLVSLGLNPSKPMRILGAIMALASAGFVIVMVKHIADSSLDGDARGFALVFLLFSAIVWLPVFLGGVALVGWGGIFRSNRRPYQPPCPACGKGLAGGKVACPSCGSVAHLKKICAECGQPRQPQHKFCRGCGSSVLQI